MKYNIRIGAIRWQILKSIKAVSCIFAQALSFQILTLYTTVEFI